MTISGSFSAQERHDEAAEFQLYTIHMTFGDQRLLL
jgi:hypothetical protein